jgi:hypothetical protein
LATKKLAVASRQHAASYFLFPHPSNFSLFPRVNIKLKDRHFDTVEVAEAEQQAVLNSLTEHDFQDAFKKKSDRLGRVHTHGWGLLGGQWAQVSF